MGRDPDGGWDDEKERRDQASAETQRRDEMTDVDVSKIKPGDVVGVRVANVGPLGPCVELGSPKVDIKNRAFAHIEAIVSHTPAPRPALKVGDRVYGPITRFERTVIWINGAYVNLNPDREGAAAPCYDLSEVEQWERV